MAKKAALRKGARLVCVPCGREVVVSESGVAATTLWCCGKPMRKPGRAKAKKKAARP